MKKTYLVTWQEVMVTTYEVEAENEEDATDAVSYGEGIEINRNFYPLPGQDALVAVKKAEKQVS